MTRNPTDYERALVRSATDAVKELRTAEEQSMRYPPTSRLGRTWRLRAQALKLELAMSRLGSMGAL